MPNDSERSTRIDPHELHDRLVRQGEDWADKNAAADLLEETKKPLIGDITKENWVWAPSHAIAEKYALADPRLKEHIGKMIEARRVANKAKVRFEATSVFIDLLRTVNANRREELRTVGIT